MANGDGVGGQVLGWIMAAAGAVAGTVSGWALWSLKRWTRDEIRVAIQRYSEEHQKATERAIEERRRFVDRQLRELKGEVAESADQLETKFAHTVAALEQHHREHERRLQNGAERFVKMETDYRHLSRDFYNLRAGLEGSKVKIFGTRSPGQDEDHS